VFVKIPNIMICGEPVESSHVDPFSKIIERLTFLSVA